MVRESIESEWQREEEEKERGRKEREREKGRRGVQAMLTIKCLIERWNTKIKKKIKIYNRTINKLLVSS